MYSERILRDSWGPSGYRLTTFELTLPRIVLAEFNTHRMISRNSASSRAIPVSKMLGRVQDDPFIPIYWGKSQKGMQASEELDPMAQDRARKTWLRARNAAVAAVKRLQMPDIDLHKQIANRLLEPWLWHTIICTATEYENFFNLRCHKDAQPEIREIAVRMKKLYTTSEPRRVDAGFIHLPLVDDYDQLVGENFSVEEIKKISVGRCARVSYLTHDGVRDPKLDIELADRLQKSGHMSPFEHVATAVTDASPSGNFRGWRQFRKELPGEDVFTAV